MRMATGTNHARPAWAAPGLLLRAGCVAWLVGIGGCGGGEQPPSATPTPAADTTAPPAAAQLVVGAALTIDGGASGTPLDLRVARSANGDGFAVWRSNNGTVVPGGGSRHDLWANRYRAVTAAWGSPVQIRAGGTEKVILEFDLAVDGSGNATVAWTEVIEGAPEVSSVVVMGARFDAGVGAWGAPVLLKAGASQPRLASDATGAVLAVYAATVSGVGGRFFDPVGGNWQPEAEIDRSAGVAGSNLPVASLDGSGNALAGFNLAAGALGSNYYSRSVGNWGQLASGETFPDTAIPGSSGNRVVENLQLTTAADGNFLLAWDHVVEFDTPFENTEIRMSHFSSRTGIWRQAQTLVQPGDQDTQFPLIKLQRIGSDADGTLLVLWTQIVGGRSAVLKAVGLDPAGTTCSVMQTIDRAIGGFAARADLAVDPQGNAIAIWQQFEGPNRPQEGASSNIAINRFDRATGTWADAVLAETQPGNAFEPHASAAGGVALLGWIQSEGGVNRVKALLQPLDDASGSR